MNYKIFQICFEQSQITDVDPLFSAFDNTENKFPELREYYNFVKFIEDGHADNLDAWGIFGPRWKDKLKYSAEEIHQTIDTNPNCDVYIFNHARVQDALTFNVWDQGEYFHKGIKKVAEHVLKELGYETGHLDEMMFDGSTCYSHYFVGTKAFWTDYLEFLIKVKKTLDNLPEDIDQIYKGSANYGRDTSLNMFVFIIERMFSTFLIMNREKYKVHAKPYDYSIYKNQVGDFAHVLNALSNLKTLTLKYDSHEIFHQWNAIRLFLLKNQPNLMNLD